jgi:hypothetical protein
MSRIIDSNGESQNWNRVHSVRWSPAENVTHAVSLAQVGLQTPGRAGADGALHGQDGFQLN